MNTPSKRPLNSIVQQGSLDSETSAQDTTPRDWRELGMKIRNEALRRTMRDARRRNGCAPRYHDRLRNPGGLS